MDEIDRWSSLDEGQFFERKSAFERPSGEVRRRKATDVARDIVETLCAMANADGGELVVGMEDDGDPTGVPHPEDKVALFLRAAGERNFVQPPLRFQARQVRTQDGKLVLHFGVDWSPEVHHLANGRYVLRVNDANMPFPAEQIAALKLTKAQGLFERSFPPGAGLNDVDLDLAASLMPKMGASGSPEEFLRRCRLLEGRSGYSVPCLAALLLFGKDPLQKKRDISNEDIREALGISRIAASRLARELCKSGWLERHGSGRGTRYRRAVRAVHYSANVARHSEAEG